MTEQSEKDEKKSTTLKLSKPVKLGDDLIEELTVRKPIAGDLWDLPTEMKMGDLLALGGKLSGHPSAVIKKLEVEDAMKLLKIVGNFIPSGQEIG